jgi:hypothetical protein
MGVERWVPEAHEREAGPKSESREVMEVMRGIVF